jgi:hypothetical protein
MVKIVELFISKTTQKFWVQASLNSIPNEKGAVKFLKRDISSQSKHLGNYFK